MFQVARVSISACSMRQTNSRTPMLQPAQVDQRIGHDLAGAVVGDLPAAVGADDRNVAGHQHVLGLAGLAQGEDRIVLEQPQLVVAVARRVRR